MKLYHPLVLLAAASLLVSGDGAAVNSPAQVHRSVEGQTGISTQRFLRTDEAVDEDDEARELTQLSTITQKLMEIAKYIPAPMRTIPGHMSAWTYRPTRWSFFWKNGLRKELDNAWKKSFRAKKYVETKSLGRRLSNWKEEGKSAKDVFKILNMREDGYKNFDMMKCLVLEEYLAMTIVRGGPTLAHYLYEIAGRDEFIYAMLLAKVLSFKEDFALGRQLSDLLLAWQWEFTPYQLKRVLESDFRDQDRALVTYLVKEYEALYFKPISAKLVAKVMAAKNAALNAKR